MQDSSVEKLFVTIVKIDKNKFIRVNVEKHAHEILCFHLKSVINPYRSVMNLRIVMILKTCVIEFDLNQNAFLKEKNVLV